MLNLKSRKKFAKQDHKWAINSLNSIAENIKHIRDEINRAEHDYHRQPNSVVLLAASKSQSIEKMQAAIESGQKIFGENYLQEAMRKMQALRQYHLEWHFIGAIQANKTQEIAENFVWAHSVSRWSIAQRLNNQRSKALPPLNICIQVNISEEKNKSGVLLAELPTLALMINQLDRLRLRGLMAIPAICKTFDEQYAIYKKVTQAQQLLIKQGLSLDTLSIGMTQDMIAAIAAGSTLVRIGTGIFGERKI